MRPAESPPLRPPESPCPPAPNAPAPPIRDSPSRTRTDAPQPRGKASPPDPASLPASVSCDQSPPPVAPACSMPAAQIHPRPSRRSPNLHLHPANVRVCSLQTFLSARVFAGASRPFGRWTTWLVRRQLRRHQANVRQIPVALREIHSISNHKLVRNCEPHIVR